MPQTQPIQRLREDSAPEHSHATVASHRKGERMRTYTYRPRPEARM